MLVNILNYTPLWIPAKAIRKCRDNERFSDSEIELIETEHESFYEKVCGEKDAELIDRIGNKNKHASTLEHLFYNFEILGISRACLQELARHRIASLTVKSTRYTLGELKKESRFIDGINYNKKTDSYSMLLAKNAEERSSKYLVKTGVERVDRHNIAKLDMLRISVHSGLSNDMTKFELPEAYKVDLVWSINARSLQNFISLRTNKDALWEIRNLANVIFSKLPNEHKYLFEDLVCKKESNV